MTTILAIYGSLVATFAALAELIPFLSTMRRRLDMQLFISPLVVDEKGRVKMRNEKGHPVVQEGTTRYATVIRAHNPGKRALQVARVDLVSAKTARPDHLSWLEMPRTIEPDDVQLWYSTFDRDDPERGIKDYSPHDLYARVTLTNGKAFESPAYSVLDWYLNPLIPSGQLAVPEWARSASGATS